LSTLRIYITGQLLLEYGDQVVTERDLPGRQGRLALAFLTANRTRPPSRSQLVEVLWPDHPPQDAETALSAILSKLRTALKKTGETTIDAHSRSIAIRWPSQTWIDIEEAAGAIDEAEGALRAGNSAKAWGFANVVVSIARRPFLQDFEAAWIEAHRAAQRTLLTRGLQCLAAPSESSGALSLALQYRNEILDLEPFRETAYQELMRQHAAMGNRAEALRVFERCRTLLRDELGASPSQQTEALFLEILRAGGS
jgi:SARP family transcriptional regulator, regulator of embCAB operon